MLRQTRASIFCAILILVFMALLVPGQNNRRSNRSSAKRTSEFNKLIKYLRAKGATVKLEDEKVSQPFFSVKGRLIIVNGEAIQVYEYPFAAKAEADARLVNSTGTAIGTSSVSWMAPPHFYRREKLIVIYVGNSAQVKSTLENILGAQFAGQ